MLEKEEKRVRREKKLEDQEGIGYSRS